MHKKIFLTLTSLVAILLVGCSGSSTYNSPAFKANSYADESLDSYCEINEISFESADSYNSDEYIDGVEEYGKKLIKTYNISLQTLNYDATISNMFNKIDEYGGYVESSSENGYSQDKSRSYNITIRIPQDKADVFLTDTEDGCLVLSSSINTEDKTLDYVDMDTRIQSYKDEIRNLQRLADKTDNVTDLLQIENNIYDLQSQIDSYQARLNHIDSKVAFSTIYLSINEAKTYKYEDLNPGF